MTLAVSILIVGVFAWLTIRGRVPALTIGKVDPNPPTAIEGAVAHATRRLHSGEISREDYERIVAILNS